MDAAIRKKVYQLLFIKPMCDYVADKNGSTLDLNVLIAGDDEKCIEVFKAVYWCGQMPEEYSLNIKIVSGLIMA